MRRVLPDRPFRSRPLAVALGFAGLALVGCSVGPDYHTPDMSVPARWSQGASGSGGASASAPRLANWWARFNDPVLNGLVAEAVAGNLDVAAAKAKVRAARAAYRQSVGALFPEVDAGASMTRADPGGGRSGPYAEANVYTRYRGGLDAGWEIDIFGGERRTVEAAIYNADAALDDLDSVLVSLVGEVALNYVDARGYQARAALARRSSASQRETAALTRRMQEAGAATQMDVANATGLAANTEANVPQLEAAFAESVNRLSVLTGRPPGALAMRLAAAKPIPTPRQPLPKGIPANVLNNRPDVRAAERRLARSTALIGTAEAQLYPSVNLAGTLATSGARLGDLARASSISWSFGPSVSVPIFNAGQLRAQVEVREAERDENFVAYRSSVLTALEEVENALVNYAQQRKREVMLNQAAVSFRESTRLSRELYENGSTTFLDVLTAERSLYSSEDSLLQSRVAISGYYVALAKALGGGWDKPVDIVTPVVVDTNTGPHLSPPMPAPPPAPPGQPW